MVVVCQLPVTQTQHVRKIPFLLSQPYYLAFVSRAIHITLSVSSNSPLDLTLDKMGLESQQVVKDRSIA